MIILQKPILFNTERIQLTQEYLLQHYRIDSSQIYIEPKIIVLHWTEENSLEKSYQLLYAPKIVDNSRPDLINHGALNVSAHFLVARNGLIYQLMPVAWMARHIIGLNPIAIGIENVGGGDRIPNLTAEQVAANSFLIQQLKNNYSSIQYVIGHFEYDCFRGTSYWQEQDSSYYNKKVDPGIEFMTAVRKQIKHLGLHQSPLTL